MATREQRERELLELREKGLATHQTDRYKDCKYLTTFISWMALPVHCCDIL